jgi:hypothetical protein
MNATDYAWRDGGRRGPAAQRRFPKNAFYGIKVKVGMLLILGNLIEVTRFFRCRTTSLKL